MKIGIQGAEGSFHSVAAKEVYEARVQLVPARSFDLLCVDLKDRRTDRAIMAIENTIAGSILTNYSLMERNRFKVLSEVYLRISLDLMAYPGTQLKNIEAIHSHPMALHQAQKFLASYSKVDVIETWDTAGAAMKIRDGKLKNIAAIAGRQAAETYGLETLAKEIETNKLNYTRFIEIVREEDYQVNPRSNKAALRFETAHKPGSLARVLDIFARNSINLSKIQSVPILGQAYRYSFHVDLFWKDSKAYQKALLELEPHLMNLIHFGDYQNNMPSEFSQGGQRE